MYEDDCIHSESSIIYALIKKENRKTDYYHESEINLQESRIFVVENIHS